jgi:heptosyltransferase-2
MSSTAVRPSPPEPRRIVVRGVNWLGDAVMTTPALLRLRERFPAAHLTLLTPAKLAELWPGHPAVDAVWPLAPGEPPWQVGRRLRAAPFDLGLIFPNSARSAWELWFGRIPRRVGYAGQWRRGLLTDAVPRPPDAVPMRKRPPAEVRRCLAAAAGVKAGAPEMPPRAHQLFHYLHLVAQVGARSEPLAPRLELTAAERAAARDLVARLAGGAVLPADRPWLGLNAGAEYGPAKRWPVERFVAVARAVEQETGAAWLILGGPNDRELAARIHRELPRAVNLAGRTRLRELMQVLSACALVLTNDTGPMHLAAALGTPVVALFGSTAPELTGPGLPGDPRHEVLRVRVPCAPCFLRVCPVDFRCMHALGVEQVTRAVLRRLGGDRVG